MINFTADELKMISNYATIMTGVSSGSRWLQKVTKVTVEVKYLIDRYGYGDKPVDMNRVEYWLFHLE